tara:strand:- start:753 stop:1016 length:264 start_codon:yes stop_codon:yes gene_type:complete
MGYGIIAKLPRKYLRCEMCHKSQMQDVYIYGSFAMPPEYVYYELEICRVCALREYGNKSKPKLDEIIKEKTEKWLKKQKNQKLQSKK